MNTLSPFPLHSELAVSEIFYFEGYALFLRNDSIIQIHIKEGFHGELQDAINVGDCIKKIGNDKKYPLLVIYSDFNTFSRENKEYSAKFQLVKAHALVNSGLAFKLMGNFYLKINKPKVPTKIFNDVESAVQWLQKFNK